MLLLTGNLQASLNNMSSYSCHAAINPYCGQEHLKVRQHSVYVPSQYVLQLLLSVIIHSAWNWILWNNASKVCVCVCATCVSCLLAKLWMQHSWNISVRAELSRWPRKRASRHGGREMRRESGEKRQSDIYRYEDNDGTRRRVRTERLG